MLHPEHFYHIYNHANGRENLFAEEKNYLFFLNKMKLHLTPYMKIYAYCLMPNHFHLLVSIRDELSLSALLKDDKSYTDLTQIEKEAYLYKKISKSVANLCSCYTQAFNKVYQRKGSLFMPNFKSNLVEDDRSFCNLANYIHSNPVHHGFVEDIRIWKFSSFLSLQSEKNSMLERQYVLEIFGGVKAFIDYHVQNAPVQGEWADG